MRWDFSRELAHAFQGPGTVEVECEGECTRGFLNDEDMEVPDPSGLLVYPAGTVLFLLPGTLRELVEHGRLMIEGAEFRADKIRKQQDGACQLVNVVRVPT